MMIFDLLRPVTRYFKLLTTPEGTKNLEILGTMLILYSWGQANIDNQFTSYALTAQFEILNGKLDLLAGTSSEPKHEIISRLAHTEKFESIVSRVNDGNNARVFLFWFGSLALLAAKVFRKPE